MESGSKGTGGPSSPPTTISMPSCAADFDTTSTVSRTRSRGIDGGQAWGSVAAVGEHVEAELTDTFDPFFAHPPTPLSPRPDRRASDPCSGCMPLLSDH